MSTHATLSSHVVRAGTETASRRLQIYGLGLRLAVGVLGVLTLVLFSSLVVSLLAQEPRTGPPATPADATQAQPREAQRETQSRETQPATIELKSIEPDLVTPALKEAAPAPGVRVKQQLLDKRNTKIYHALYLPKNWVKDRHWPVLVEYPGNGPYSNNLGDTNSGFVDDCNFAYGISGGESFICLTLPCVNADRQENQRQWWGDPQATVEYCLAAVDLVCRDFGGDREQLVLCGFSRGGIACNYIGLRDDKIAPLWKCFIVHSHYDGVRRWPYDDSDATSARKRLARLNGRAQYITHESSVAATEQYLNESQKLAEKALGKFTCVSLPFPNHTDTWVLRDIEPRRALRAWLNDQLSPAM